MRALRVVGLGEDGKTVILEDPMRGERFQLPADERLRAAARGDVTRLGQIEIELESQMRPREIQARIRAGESVAQVAEASGLPEDKVERFAYPVLLERSRTADLAQRAHPVREDGPDVQTLGEVCAHAFGLRGQEYSEAVWDSWKNEENKWIVQLRWTAGRSDNHAHWSFHPGAHGGTVTPLDDHAHDLLDPNPNRSLRTVRPVTELARQALAVEAPPRPDPAAAPGAGTAPGTGASGSASASVEPVYQEPVHRQPEPVGQPEPTYREPEPAHREPAYREPAHREPAHREPEPVYREPEPAAPPAAPAPAAPAVPAAPAAAHQPPAEPVAQPEPEPAPAAEPAAASTKPVQEELVPEPEPKPEAAKEKPAPRRGKKKNHPVVPAWEDVLLGVRSNRG
ncbi:DUF3071 domain-containing protein [Kibdelosporangium aridum]|uniref:DUF3071 domain-containing protein n=1 Tax=Kibdelosporangium aridum TaxID=2030 RepID=A0A428YZD7_KIBAR|nr:septation protein SepH [Kibdelosporangium aridum]RSM76031.1 DUF3071 domain-containing protein [Kibdelosporangium aridum]